VNGILPLSLRGSETTEAVSLDCFTALATIKYDDKITSLGKIKYFVKGAIVQ